MAPAFVCSPDSDSKTFGFLNENKMLIPIVKFTLYSRAQIFKPCFIYIFRSAGLKKGKGIYSKMFYVWLLIALWEVLNPRNPKKTFETFKIATFLLILG